MTDDDVSPHKLNRVDMVYNRTWADVAAPLDEVFWAVFDYPSWQGYDSIEHVSGRAGEEGELVLIDKPQSWIGWQQKFCKTIKLDPPRQIIWRVYTGPGQVGPNGWEREFDVTVDYRFEPIGPDQTAIHMQVIKEFFVPEQDENELARIQQEEYQFQVAVMEDHAPRLFELLARKANQASS